MAIEFDGVSQYVDIGTLGNFGANIGNGCTVAFWVQTTTTETKKAFLGTISTENRMIFAINANRGFPGLNDGAVGYTQFYLRDVNEAYLVGYINENIYDGAWHHIVWRIVNPASNSHEAYVDGIQVALTNTDATNPTTWANFQWPVVIGAWNLRNSITNYVAASIDDVCFWTIPLTANEIATLAKSKRRLPLSIRGDHIVGYWRLDGPNGAVAAGANSILDLSGNGNHGTPYNDPVYRGSILTYPE